MVKIDYTPQTNMAFFRTSEAEQIICEAFNKAREQEIPVRVDSLDAYNVAYHICGAVMNDKAPEDELDNYCEFAKYNLGSLPKADITLTLVWALLSVQDEMPEDKRFFMTRLEGRVSETSFFKEMRSGVEECKQKELTFYSDFSGILTEDKNEAIASAKEYVSRLIPLVKVELKDKYLLIWNNLLSDKVILRSFYHRGKMGKLFNRNMVLNIIAQMNKRHHVFTTDEANSFARLLESDQYDRIRKIVSAVSDNTAIVKAVDRVIASFL